MNTKLKSVFEYILLTTAIVSVCIVTYDVWLERGQQNPFGELTNAFKKGQKNLPKILVESPISNNVIMSPVVIKGQASEIWFFEEQFSVVLTDQYRNIISSSIVLASGDSTAEGLVPFEGGISFVKPDTKSGFLIFEREDLSGDGFPLQFDIPILFE